MFNRVKRIWKLSKIEGLENADSITVTEGSKVVQIVEASESIESGNAVFISLGTEEEHKEFEKEEKGLKGIFGL